MSTAVKTYPRMCLYKSPEFFSCDEIESWRWLYLETEKPEEYDEGNFYEWLYCQVSDYLDDDRENMKHSPYANMPCVITGSLGLWHGRPSIEPVAMGDLMDAVDKCIRTNYNSHSKVELIDGRIEVEVAHHDGTNHFTVSLLNQKGQRAGADADLSKTCYHKKIKGYLF